MIRDNLSDSSAHAFMAMTTANGDAFQYRMAQGGESSSIHDSTDPIKAPYWVKLTRVGDLFQAYSSPDGELWDFVGRATIPMADPVFVGGAVVSHVYMTSTTATFTDIDVSDTPMEPPLNFNIVIDAKKDGWYNVLTGPENGYLSIPAAAYNSNGQPNDNADLSAFMWTAWDENYLYVYEEVTDDVVALDNATSYQNDVLEMYFDPDPMGDVTSGQIGITITALIHRMLMKPITAASQTSRVTALLQVMLCLLMTMPALKQHEAIPLKPV
jgi:hypothetical protein